MASKPEVALEPPAQAARPLSTGWSERAFQALTLLDATLVVVALHFVFLRAPVEARMGIVQKIFYFHVPSAFAMYLGAIACFLGSLAYLVHPSESRDAFARAGAEVAVAFGAIVLVTGPLWASKAWGSYWTWDPRLTTSLISVLIYVAYVMLRSFGGGGEAVRKFAAALGFLGAVNLPIIHFSVQKWSGQHPRVLGQGGGGLQHVDMKIAFAVASITMLLFAALLLWSRWRIALAHSRVQRLSQEALELGVVDEG
ncbi:MAG: cytochrome c biogenesis protein [Polyangiaceae bacterium]|nr:cytochrome c biogenesis protein [Polyangiaceae bacterium]